MKMGGWSSDSKMELRSPRRCKGRYDYSPWWGPLDPHHGLFSLKRLCLFETVAFLGKVLVLEKYYLKGDRAWWMPAQMHPLTAESLALSGFPGKKKRTKHRHIVSMFGPIMVRVVGLEPTRLTAEEPKSSESTISTIPAYMSDSAFCRYFAVL